MKRIAWLLLVACGQSGGAKAPDHPPSSPALNALMNKQVNPAFTSLSFLAFHAGDAEDPAAAHADLARAADKLAAAMSQLSTWPDPPVTSDEGREVFHTYAVSIDADARRLVEAVAANDSAGSTRTLEKIAETCNNCHHFFRLKIEDSVVKPK